MAFNQTEKQEKGIGFIHHQSFAAVVETSKKI